MKKLHPHTLYPHARVRKFGILCGSLLLGLPFIPMVAVAQQQQNPCPGIYYEEPHNSTRMSPQGCPPNAFAQMMGAQGQLPGTQPQMGVGGPMGTIPSPQTGIGQNVIATLPPGTSAVDILLRNDTSTQITYQVVGQTQLRTLAGGEQVVLQGLPVPATFTMTRPDGGFIRAMPMSTTGRQLAVSLNEAANLNQSQRTLRIEQNGQVLAY